MSTIYISDPTGWTNASTSTVAYTLSTGTSTNPPAVAPVPRTEVDHMLTEVDKVCRLAQS